MQPGALVRLRVAVFHRLGRIIVNTSGPGTSSSLEGQLDASVVGVAERCLHVSAVDDVLHVAPLYKEVVKLVSSAVAEGGGPGVVVILFKACGCDDQSVLEAEI